MQVCSSVPRLQAGRRPPCIAAQHPSSPSPGSAIQNRLPEAQGDSGGVVDGARAGHLSGHHSCSTRNGITSLVIQLNLHRNTKSFERITHALEAQ